MVKNKKLRLFSLLRLQNADPFLFGKTENK